MRSVVWAREKADLASSEAAGDVLAAHVMGLGVGAALIMSLTTVLAVAVRHLSAF